MKEITVRATKDMLEVSIDVDGVVAVEFGGDGPEEVAHQVGFEIKRLVKESGMALHQIKMNLVIGDVTRAINPMTFA